MLVCRVRLLNASGAIQRKFRWSDHNAFKRQPYFRETLNATSASCASICRLPRYMLEFTRRVYEYSPGSAKSRA